MAKRAHTYRVTVEHVASAWIGEPPNPVPLVFDARNHDDILQIVERARRVTSLGSDEAAAMAVGLKLLSEVALAHRSEDLFSDLSGALGAFIGKLKARPQAA
ncbi:DUF3861 domain-containing protein [Methylobacterium fujisawaense]|uniref:DUF3861 domain-containing protein n=1 Tax=Methylobacterium fujisawaense TaxID=107400 RepID=UPI0036F9D0B0